MEDTVDKIAQACAILVQLRDDIEDALDELMPPPAEELHEAALSEAPPDKGRSGPRVPRSSFELPGRKRA